MSVGSGALSFGSEAGDPHAESEASAANDAAPARKLRREMPRARLPAAPPETLAVAAATSAGAPAAKPSAPSACSLWLERLSMFAPSPLLVLEGSADRTADSAATPAQEALYEVSSNRSRYQQSANSGTANRFFMVLATPPCSLSASRSTRACSGPRYPSTYSPWRCGSESSRPSAHLRCEGTTPRAPAARL